MLCWYRLAFLLCCGHTVLSSLVVQHSCRPDAGPLCLLLPPRGGTMPGAGRCADQIQVRTRTCKCRYAPPQSAYNIQQALPAFLLLSHHSSQAAGPQGAAGRPYLIRPCHPCSHACGTAQWRAVPYTAAGGRWTGESMNLQACMGRGKPASSLQPCTSIGTIGNSRQYCNEGIIKLCR